MKTHSDQNIAASSRANANQTFFSGLNDNENSFLNSFSISFKPPPFIYDLEQKICKKFFGSEKDENQNENSNQSLDENLKQDQANTNPGIELNNGEVIFGPYSNEQINEFNQLYDQDTANGTEIPIEVWNFSSFLNGESIVGNYVVNYIQNLPEVPEDYEYPATFDLNGVLPTYNAADEYANPGGNCYTTTASRVNKAYEDLYETTPIDYTQNPNGTFTSIDYKIASSQEGIPNFGYGVGGALGHGGEGELVDNDGVWSGELKPGAALQIWHSTDEESISQNGGHSQIFLNYNYGENGEINGLDVFDNSGEVETLERTFYEENETIKGANLIDP